MIRQSFSVLILVSAAASPSNASQCLDAGKVRDLIVQNVVGVEDVYFSHVQGASNSFVFKLRGGKVLAVDHDGQCVFRADVMTQKQYIQSTIEPADECDGCGEEAD